MSTRFTVGQVDYIFQLNLMDDQLQTGTVNKAATANAIAVNVDDATNANFFPLFVASGGAGITPADSSKFKYNPSTGAVTAVSFVGALTGNASTATTSSNVGITTDNASSATYYPAFVNTAGGTVSVKNSANLTFIPSTGLLTSFAYRANGTGGIGYTTGAGGTVAQITSKVTAVTLNKPFGDITMFATDSIAAGAVNTFTLTNSAIAATDTLVLNHQSGGTAGSYTLNAQCAAGSASINVRNVTAGALAEAIVIRFAVLKGALA